MALSPEDGAGISFAGVTKTYGGLAVVDAVSFNCPAGSITGFLGPNGAGKSTTLRIAAGLTHADSGEVLFAGRRRRDLESPGRSIGFVLDPTALHPGRTLQETLKLNAMLLDVPPSAVQDALDMTGLTAVRKKRVGSLSLGMRQRLVLGMALLAAPQFLVMDEPTNGLDADGALWVRGFLKHFSAQGGTVLLSSHLLRDMQAVADHIVMIDRGRIVASGPAAEFSTSARTRATALDPALLHEACRRRNWTFDQSGDGFIIDASPEEIGRVSLEHGIVLTHLSNITESALEDRFLALTSGEFNSRNTNLDQVR
ncbi:ATP-binding cassette domain-containing protein [Pseudarthrobacter sp. J64]|uniref:ABC transporter ATP-binding protein n=1 Tax=Pseudarthrobacter sp. J64 TaxID=3116485 RepID=UPI002E7FF541|nr:ATP-binding cassette domain-containing protein [Pseudarthrobacter sp. J64]MEE2568787.1 ATP-binding cassette domain-containing protein [Pseudarthrobacter sp. J64]